MELLNKLPKEVLDLFPVWEYRCPVCQTYVESRISFCPNCKTAFDEEKWRVPPRFLKNRKAMSEYAHKVLAPKLNEKQRTLLFKYFTELFSDGFESGDFSAWDGTAFTGWAGEEHYVDDTQKKAGTYSEYCKIHGAGSYAYVYEVDSFSNLLELYLREYFRLGTLPSSTNDEKILEILDTSDDSINLRVLNDGGTMKLKVQYADGWTWTSATSGALTINVDTWYCAEMRVKMTNPGELEIWFEGTKEIDLTPDLDTRYDYCDEIRVGLMGMSGTSEWGIAWFDCVVVADTYIGPISEGETYTKTWQADALFKKLGISKTALVNAAFKKLDTTETFTVDSAFLKTTQIQKQVNSLFKKLDISKTFNIDVNLLKHNIVKSFAVDAHFTALVTHTISLAIDALFKKHDIPKAFAVDTYIGEVSAETHTKTIGIDTTFSYKAKLPPILGITLNGQIVIPVKKEVWIGG